MLSSAFRVALLAGSLALDVFAVGVGVGIRGASVAARVRIGLAFAGAEVLMNVLGVALGAAAGRVVGAVAGYLGFAALIGVGLWMIVEALREREVTFDLSRGWGLTLASLSVSLDSLGVGFSILYVGVPLVPTLIAIALASFTSTTLGLTFGRFLGRRAESSAALAAGAVLVATGILFAALKFAGGR
ncbi:MAG: manganese efflux pump [Candidatus Baltobacteraceae bacterium]|jgi:putative Mn2+ efflux pump MntP